MSRTFWRHACLLVCLCLAPGCKSVGPETILSDRFDYGSALSDSWKRHTLLNVIKMRYADTPTFVEVGQIVAGYTMETSSAGGAELGTGSTLPGNTLSLSIGGSVRYTDRPTVTYVPLTGPKFVKSIMTPLPPEAVFFLIQSGMPADRILTMCLSSLSGLSNQQGPNPPSPDFLRAIDLIKQLQSSDAVSMRVLDDGKKHLTPYLSLPIDPSGQVLRTVMRLDPQLEEFKLTYGVGHNPGAREINVRTRSLLQIMQQMSLEVEVPERDIADGRAAPGLSQLRHQDPHRLLTVHSSQEEPVGAVVAVFYRGSWFWIDDRDFLSKRTFSFLLLLFAVSDSGSQEPLPLITIPAQ